MQNVTGGTALYGLYRKLLPQRKCFQSFSLGRKNKVSILGILVVNTVWFLQVFYLLDIG